MAGWAATSTTVVLTMAPAFTSPLWAQTTVTDGSTGFQFLHNPEVINDFAFRAIHVEAVVGKQIVKAYYTHAHTKSYYLGCSTGGRQGTQSALKYPADFDGILAGAPATDFNHLQYWTGITAKHLGSPTPESSPSYIPLDTWHDLIAEVVLKTCDLLDGVEDGTITEPDDCKFDPQVLLCGKYSTSCLTQAQVDALHKIYSPVYVDGKLIYPRFDPGAENDTASASLLSGAFPDFPKNWLRYAVLNDTHFDGSEFNETHLRAMDQVNPGGISTFDGDFSVFRARGGKFLTYHGRMDSLIASGNSKRYHDLVAQDFDTPDDFYRLFLVPGMGHCAGGPGATKFGQLGRETTAAKNDSQHNILLALVDWVENGLAPEIIIGTTADGRTRSHCLHPAKSVWDGSDFVCES